MEKVGFIRVTQANVNLQGVVLYAENATGWIIGSTFIQIRVIFRKEEDYCLFSCCFSKVTEALIIQYKDTSKIL